MRARALTPTLALLLLTSCGHPGARTADRPPPATPPLSATQPLSPTQPATPSAAGPATTAPPGSGISPPTLNTYSAKLSDQRVTAAQAPTRLRISGIGVDGAVAAIGVGADGQLAVPPEAAGLSWYRFGPSPGEPGSAVVVGHVDFGGVEGVFWRLDELRAGEPVEVGFGDGSLKRFTVVSRQEYPKSSLPMSEVFRPDGPPMLVLVTCGGSFDPARRSYRDNIVVTAQATGA